MYMCSQLFMHACRSIYICIYYVKKVFRALLQESKHEDS